MRRILAQARKELTQIVARQTGPGAGAGAAAGLLILLGTAISLTVTDLPIVVQDLDDSPASRDFIDAFRASITFHVVPWPVGQAAGRGVPDEHGARRRSSFPSTSGATWRAARTTAGADAGRCLRCQHRQARAGLRGRDRRGLQRARRGRAPAPVTGRHPALVQPGTRLEKVLRARHLRARHLHVSAAAGRARHGERRRAEDHPAGLRFEHFGA